MRCFQLPKGLYEDIEGMMRRFWWGQREQESKIAWVTWKNLCKSKLKGGMGFRNLQAFNLARLTKQGWRLLLNPNSPIARIYKAKYYPHGDVLNSKLGCNPSYAWRSIFVVSKFGSNSKGHSMEGRKWEVNSYMGRQMASNSVNLQGRIPLLPL